MHSVGEGYCQSLASVAWSGETDVEARMTTYSMLLQITTTGSTTFDHVAKVAPGKGHA